MWDQAEWGSGSRDGDKWTERDSSQDKGVCGWGQIEKEDGTGLAVCLDH